MTAVVAFSTALSLIAAGQFLQDEVSPRTSLFTV
jgi:hypothetical protein